MGQASKTVRCGVPLVLAMVCGVAAYSNSLRGPFIFDDIDAILNNPRVNRSLADSGRNVPTTLSGRPVLWGSFAADYFVGGMHVEVYHVTNLLIHLASGAVVFGIVRRTLLCEPVWGSRFAESAGWLAGAVTAVWLVHPLNTEAVTYTVQRAESLAGFFYLLVIYGAMRDWKVAAMIACALGLGTKEVVATAPIVALIYDRTFLSGSLAGAIKRRAGLYAGLAMTWAIPAATVIGGARGASVGNISPMDYGRTQLGVIWHYIALTFWPRYLVLDYYDWPIVHSWDGVGWGGMLVVMMIVLAVGALWWRPWVGFLGMWFFVILAPSSSVLPIFTEVAAEHRMYLPLVAVVALVVVGGWVTMSRCVAGAWIAGVLVTILLAALSARTFLRNAEYENPEAIWTDNVIERPLNPRAHFNLGYTLMGLGRPGEAEREFQTALDLEPDYVAALRELMRAHIESGGPAPADGRGR